jgi:hypothetical protein
MSMVAAQLGGEQKNKPSMRRRTRSREEPNFKRQKKLSEVSG